MSANRRGHRAGRPRQSQPVGKIAAPIKLIPNLRQHNPLAKAMPAQCGVSTRGRMMSGLGLLVLILNFGISWWNARVTGL